jgi:hypothetical protein
MSMPPGMWDNEDAFQPPEIEEAEERYDHTEHEHGPDCGHEAVEHDGHTDYVHEGHRHWWNVDHWDTH